MQNALIVDDSALARLTLKRFLTKHNLNVFEAECVADCRYWLRHNQLPDVIFMDITMPEIDGFEALAEIRSDPETKHLPVIMYSGDGSEAAKQRAREGKATGFLRKPVSEPQLVVLLDKLNERYGKAPTAVTTNTASTDHPSTNIQNQLDDYGKAIPEAVNEVRDLRNDVGKIYVTFERQQESLTSLKTLVQRQSNDLAHLQNNIQQNEKSMKKLAILAASAVGLAIMGIVLLLVS